MFPEVRDTDRPGAALAGRTVICHFNHVSRLGLGTTLLDYSRMASKAWLDLNPAKISAVSADR
jgi:hypothetical protein